MKLKTLHIISLDVPIPADYGGVIDIFHRAEAIKKLGVRVILHCFEYGRNTEQDFSKIADEVHFYKRKRSILNLFKSKPFIVTSRNSRKLVDYLLGDNHPILMEGHHCAGLLNHPELNDRKKFVRIHNMEWKYYKELSVSHTSFWRKLFFKNESRKLKKFDTTLASADGLFCLSSTELEHYKLINPATFLWPVGCNLEIEKDFTTMDHALFHGNLSVIENEKSLRWLVQIWFKNNLKTPLVVAGKNPSLHLKKYLKRYAFVELIENPSNEKMTQLIGSAKINLLITFQSTGMKLKLLNALVHGKYCIVNPMMVEGTDLSQFCEVIQDEEELADLIQRIESNGVNNQNLTSRKEYLEKHFDVLKNTKKALEIIAHK